jgi:hypothetical protein
LDYSALNAAIKSLSPSHRRDSLSKPRPTEQLPELSFQNPLTNPQFLRETRLWLNQEETERLMRFLREEMWPRPQRHVQTAEPRSNQ